MDAVLLYLLRQLVSTVAPCVQFSCMCLVHRCWSRRKILFLGRARLQGCTSGFVCNCRQNEDDTKANESTDVGTDEDLDGGSNNGASLRGRSQ